MDNKPQKRTKREDTEEDHYAEQGKLEYLRGPAGERDRRTIWKDAQGTLPGTGAGGLKEGWLNDAD